MLKYEWLLTAIILRLNWLFQVQTVPFELSDYKYLKSIILIRAVKQPIKIKYFRPVGNKHQLLRPPY